MKIEISTNNIKITDDTNQEFNYALSQLVGQAYVRKNGVDTLILSFSLGPYSYHEIPLVTSLLLNGVAFVSVATFKLLLSASVASNTSVGSGGISVEAEYKSPTDFTTQRRPVASQIELLNLNVPITTSSQLKFITVTNLGTKLTKQYVNGSEQISLYWDPATSRITINKDGVALNAFPQGSGANITITLSGSTLAGIGVSTSTATNYAVGDIFSVVQSGGSGGQGIVTSVDSVGNPTGYAVYAVGTGYSTAVGAPAVTVSAVTTYGNDAFVVVGIDGQEKGYDSVTNAFINFMNNYPVQPLHNVLIAPSTSVIADSWFPSKDGLDVGFHKRHVFTGILAPAASQVLTMIVEGTNADDLTVDANWTALDFYNVVGLTTVNTLATAAGTSTSFNIRLQDCGYRNIRYRLTPSVNTNANTCNCYLNSTY
jgi:hypothetical protein